LPDSTAKQAAKSSLKTLIEEKTLNSGRYSAGNRRMFCGYRRAAARGGRDIPPVSDPVQFPC
jgi:hypothetical protein